MRIYVGEGVICEITKEMVLLAIERDLGEQDPKRDGRGAFEERAFF